MIQYNGSCGECGDQAALTPRGNYRKFCADCMRKKNARRQLGFLSGYSDPIPVRPMCSCEHYLSLHMPNGCVVCQCRVLGTGQLPTTPAASYYHGLASKIGEQVA